MNELNDPQSDPLETILFSAQEHLEAATADLSEIKTPLDSEMLEDIGRVLAGFQQELQRVQALVIERDDIIFSAQDHLETATADLSEIKTPLDSEMLEDVESAFAGFQHEFQRVQALVIEKKQ